MEYNIQSYITEDTRPLYEKIIVIIIYYIILYYIMETYIDGPINIIKISGKINDTVKKLYLFMDNHKPIEQQSKCSSDKNSIDIVKFFKDNFESYTKEDDIDFFLEISKYETKLKYSDDISRTIYINRIRNFFNGYKPKPKIRFHYADSRSWFLNNIDNDMDFINAILKNVSFDREILRQNSEYLVDDLGELLEFIETTLYKIKEYSTTDLDFDRIETNKEDKNYIYFRLLYKLIKKYNDPNNSKNIINLITFFSSNLQETHYKLTRIKHNLLKINTDNIKIKDNKIILEQYLLILNEFFNNMTFFMDIFFLRRFIDKTYIKNGIIYCGYQHACSVILFLLKFYDFNIEYASYPDKGSLYFKQLKYSIKTQDFNLKSLFFIMKILVPDILDSEFQTNKDKSLQCSKIDSKSLF